MKTLDDVASGIRALFEKRRKTLIAESERALGQLAKAEAAALKPFEKSAPTANGAPKTRNRGARLSPDVQTAILAAMSDSMGYTVKEIADLSKAGRSQVRTALAIAVKSGKVVTGAGKRNKKYQLAAELPLREASNA